MVFEKKSTGGERRLWPLREATLPIRNLENIVNVLLRFDKQKTKVLPGGTQPLKLSLEVKNHAF